MSQITNSTAINLSQPGAGQTIVVPVDQDHMRMALGFAPDPNAVAKNGQDLEFTFEDGGKIVLQGYYDHFTNKTLPTMVTESGDELPGEDFLASLREDLLTAAGPGAGGNQAGGGSGEYADDPGALIDGIDRLGSLGTIYWGYDYEVPEQYENENPSGAGSLSVITDLMDRDEFGRIVVGVFEDARPFQHVEDPNKPENFDLRYGQMQFGFNGTGTTVCDFVNMTGFHVGTVIYLGNPDDPNTVSITITDVNQTVRVPAGQFSGDGVFLLPPTNSDADMDITSTLEIRATSSGNTATIPGPSFVVVVDAVADKPIAEGTANLDVDLSGAGMGVDEKTGADAHKQEFEDGWSKDVFDKHSESATATGEGVKITAEFQSDATFFDFKDGSEHHYALIEVPSDANWSQPGGNPADSQNAGTWKIDKAVIVDANGVEHTVDVTGVKEITLYFDAKGKCLGETLPEGANPADYTSRTYFQLEIDNADIRDYDNGAEGGVTIKYTMSSTDSNLTEDTTFTLDGGAKSWEDPSDDELTYDNNTSYTLISETTDTTPAYPQMKVDTIDSQLTIQVGWASEDNDPTKHGGAAGDPKKMIDHGADDDKTSHTDPGHKGVDGDSTAGVDGAPITLSLGAPTHSGDGGNVGDANAEVITSVKLTLPAGTLYAGNQALTDGFDGDIGGAHYKVEGNVVTITPIDDHDDTTFDSLGRDLNNLDLVFKPEGGSHSHADLVDGLKYEVTVEQPDTGASATFKGSSTVVIDAVADLATGMTLDHAYQIDEYGQQSAAKPGAEGEAIIKGSVSFPDTSEHLFLVINVAAPAVDAPNWKATADAQAGKDGGQLFSQQELYDLWKGIGGHNLPTDDILFPRSGKAGVGEYLIITLDEHGEPRLYASDGSGGLRDVSDAFGFKGSIDANGNLTYSLELDTPPVTSGDTQYTIFTTAVTVVEDPNPDHEPGQEYDYSNNISHIEDRATTKIDVKPANASSSGETEGTYETADGTFANVDPNKNWQEGGEKSMKDGSALNDATGQHTAPGGPYTNVTVNHDTLGDITFSVDNGGDTPEYITQVAFTIKGNLEDQGTLWLYDADGNPTIQIDAHPQGYTGGAYYYVEGGNTYVVIPNTDGFTNAETSFTLKYVPGSFSEKDLTIIDNDVTVVNRDSHDKVTLHSDTDLTVLVDAVAAKPLDLAHDDPKYNGEQESAKVGEEVKIDFSLKFKDMGDPDEQHSLLLSVPANNCGKYTTLTLLGTGGFPIDLANLPDGITVTKITIDGQSYFKISGPALESYLQQHANSDGVATVDAQLTMDAPNAAGVGTTPTGDKDFNYRFGGMTEDRDESPDQPVTTNNDEAFASDKFTITVSTVGTKVAVTTDVAYENADRNANEGYVHFPRDNSLTAEQLAALKDDGGAIHVKLTNTNVNEVVTHATFVVDYKDASITDVPGNFMYTDSQGVNHLILLPAYPDTTADMIIDGNTVTCTVDWDNGTVRVDIPDFNPLDAAGKSTLTFIPDENYRSDDVHLDYAVTVHDNKSDQDKTFTNNDKLLPANPGTKGVDYETTDYNESEHGITVDAVAQLADVTNLTVDGGIIKDPDTNEYYNKIIPGEDAHVKMTVDLHGDYKDGSEGHVFYVKTGSNIDYPVKSVSITYLGADGDYHTVTVLAADLGGQKTDMAGQAEGSPSFYETLDIEAAIEKFANGDPDLALASGEVKIDVTVGTPGGEGKTTVEMGVNSHEDWYEVNPTDGSDKEYTEANNDAWRHMHIDIEQSPAAQPGFTIKNVFYENSNADAYLGLETWGAGVKIELDLGDPNDRLVTSDWTDPGTGKTYEAFSLELQGENANLGDLLIFPDPADYKAFADLVKGGSSPYDLLQNEFAGKFINCHGKITWDDIKDYYEDGIDGHFTGQIVFMPSEDSYSGVNPVITGNITVIDGDSGQIASITDQSKGILADAVAQQPKGGLTDGDDPLHYDGHQDGVIREGQERKVTINARFEDMDTGAQGTEHFILIEAVAGWTLTYKYTGPDGNPVTGTVDPDNLYYKDGKVYFKIPVEPTAIDDDHGTVSLELTMQTPDSSVFYHMNDGEYSLEALAGSTDKDTQDGELTFHNNTATISFGSIDGKLDHVHDGTWIFEQRTPLYEDNDPDSHLATNDPTDDPVGGTFYVGHGGCEDGTVEIVPPYVRDADGNLIMGSDGYPLSAITIEGGTYENGVWTVDLGPSGYTEITVTLSKDYLDNGGGQSDKDLEFGDITFKDDSGSEYTVPAGTDILVDAVADWGEVSVRHDTVDINDSDDATNNRLHDTVAGTKDDPSDPEADDAKVYFTVEATFPDHDGSETHYVLVEQTPMWEATGYTDTVYINDKTYYRFEVKNEDIGPDGKVSVEVEMTYKGSGAGNMADILDIKEDEPGYVPGVSKYELQVGTMSQEHPQDGEADMQNNMAVNLEESIILEYSPVTSEVKIEVSPSSTVEGLGNTITLDLHKFAIDTDATQDKLMDLTVNYSVKGGANAGTLWLVDADGNHVGSPIASGTTFTGTDLDKLNSGEYKLVFEQNDYNNKDIHFDWSGTVKDLHSGATATKTGSHDVIMDAKAHLGDVDRSVSDVDGSHAAVANGANAIVTITAEFPDTENTGTEQHWVVLEQKDLRYSVTKAEIFDENGNSLGTAQVVTKFDENGKPYFAVEMPANGHSVQFTVTTPEWDEDTSIDLMGGAIVIETTKDVPGGDRESDYENNWAQDLEKITIETGVLETKAGDISGSGSGNEGEAATVNIVVAGLDDHNEFVSHLDFTVPAGATLYYNGMVVPATGLYFSKDGPAFDSSLLTIENNDPYKSGNLTLKYKVTVEDKASGDSETFPEKSATITVNEVAHEPSAPTISDAHFDGGLLVMTLSAVYPDLNGEYHAFLVTVPAGLHLVGDYQEYGQPGSGIYIVPMDSESAAGSTAQISFTADPSYDGSAEIEVQAASAVGNDVAIAPASATVDTSTVIGDFDYYTVHGTAGNDVIDASDSTLPVHIDGGAGNDTIYGSDHDDIINGGAGNDLIYGGLGDDIMSGGAGADTFAWTADDVAAGGLDTILDFEMGTDRLLFESLFGDAQFSPEGLVDKIKGGVIDIEVTGDKEVQVTMGDQIVDIHLNNALGSDYTTGDLDTDAKATLLEMMINQAVGG